MDALLAIWQYPAVLAVLIFLLVAVARGWLIPKASHERELTVANKRGDEWKETAKAWEAANTEMSKQIGQLVAAGSRSVSKPPTQPTAIHAPTGTVGGG